MKYSSRKWLLILLGVVLSPLLLVTLSLVNPMGLAFLAKFEVENRTDANIQVTPLGAVGNKGARNTLPYSVLSFICLPSLASRDFVILPGKSRAFVYDWDDIQFCEILVKGGRTQEYRVLSTGLNPTEGQYRLPKTRHFVVSDLTLLPVAEQFQLDAISGKHKRLWLFYVLAVAGLVSPVAFVLGLRMKTE